MLFRGDMIGIKAEVAKITERAMRGEIEYDQSLRERLALLKGLDESALQRVYDERLKFSPGAERMLETVRRAGIRTLLVSGGFSFMTERLKSRVQLDYAHSNVLEIVGGRLTGAVVGGIVNADAKRAALLKVAGKLGLKREQIAGVGDGANDLKFMAECGVSVAYRAKPVVREQTSYAINHSGLDALPWLLSAENT